MSIAPFAGRRFRRAIPIGRIVRSTFYVPDVMRFFRRWANKDGAGNGGSAYGFMVASGSAVPDLDR